MINADTINYDIIKKLLTNTKYATTLDDLNKNYNHFEFISVDDEFISIKLSNIRKHSITTIYSFIDTNEYMVELRKLKLKNITNGV